LATPDIPLWIFHWKLFRGLKIIWWEFYKKDIWRMPGISEKGLSIRAQDYSEEFLFQKVTLIPGLNPLKRFSLAFFNSGKA